MSLIIQPNELSASRPVSALIYGQPGIGKTSLALSAPKPLLLDLDRGLYRVEKRFQCPSVQVENYQQVLDVLGSPEIDIFETIVVDTLGKLVDRMIDHITRTNPKLKQYDGSLAMKGWGVLKIQFQMLLSKMFDKNKNIIFVAHEREDKDGDLRFLRPDVCGSAGKDIVKELDLMGYMEMRGMRRTISFTPTEKYYAKNSLGLSPVIEVPDMLTGNTFFSDKILSELAKKKALETEINTKYENLKKSQCEKIEHVSTIEDLNIVYEILQNDEKLWDSGLCWKKKLKEKCDSLNAVFNKNIGKFEQAI